MDAASGKLDKIANESKKEEKKPKKKKKDASIRNDSAPMAIGMNSLLEMWPLALNAARQMVEDVDPRGLCALLDEFFKKFNINIRVQCMALVGKRKDGQTRTCMAFSGHLKTCACDGCIRDSENMVKAATEHLEEVMRKSCQKKPD
jgi:hypothetical protein